MVHVSMVLVTEGGKGGWMALRMKLNPDTYIKSPIFYLCPFFPLISSARFRIVLAHDFSIIGKQG